MHDAVREALIEAAREGRVLTYADVGPLVGVAMTRPGDRLAVAQVLLAIGHDEFHWGRPLLPAVVVREDLRRPGPGFFTLARELGLRGGESDEAFFREELARVFDYWRPRPGGATPPLGGRAA